MRPMTRLHDPQMAHERLAAREHGVKGGRELDEDSRSLFEQTRTASADLPRLTGNWTDGSAMRDLVRILALQGLLVDETTES